MTHVDLAKETEQNEPTEEARKSDEFRTGECIFVCIDAILCALTCWS
jgi:hypothetical protein